jgi:hypothetical protein
VVLHQAPQFATELCLHLFCSPLSARLYVNTTIRLLLRIMTNRALRQLLWAAVLSCLACTVCSRTLAGFSITVNHAKKADSQV